MKVKSVERFVVNVPFTKRQEKITAREVYNWSILELCRVETDSGDLYLWRLVESRATALARARRR